MALEIAQSFNYTRKLAAISYGDRSSCIGSCCGLTEIIAPGSSFCEISKKYFRIRPNVMNREHPNLAVMQRFNPANITESADVIAEDAVFHYFNPELSELEGDYIGADGFGEFFQKIANQTEGTFKVNLVTITPVGDELVVTHVRDTILLKGQQLEIDAVVVWRIVDDKIKEVWDIPAVYTASK